MTKHAIGVFNGNWKHRWAFISDEIEDARQRTASFRLEKCQRIRDTMTQDEYNAWWASTPDDDAGFDAAVDAKLAELEAAQAERDAATLAAETARWADQDEDYRDWYATRESVRP